MKNELRFILTVALAACSVLILAVGLQRQDVALLGPAKLLLISALAVTYVVPTCLAVYRDCRSTGWIALLNIALGWTVLGWFFAFGWAVRGQVRDAGSPLHTPPTHPLPGH